MSCVDWQERIALCAGGDATSAEAREVERHLRACAGCQVFWSGMRETLANLREVHEELPDAAHFTAVRARVIGEIEGRRRTWRRLAWISAMTAIVLVMVTFGPARTPIPEAPRILAAIPPAPLLASVPATLVKARQAKAHREPITVRLQTSDPSIVIYWIAD